MHYTLQRALLTMHLLIETDGRLRLFTLIRSFVWDKALSTLETLIVLLVTATVTVALKPAKESDRSDEELQHVPNSAHGYFKPIGK